MSLDKHHNHDRLRFNRTSSRSRNEAREEILGWVSDEHDLDPKRDRGPSAPRGRFAAQAHVLEKTHHSG
jgi:hypothetical protein